MASGGVGDIKKLWQQGEDLSLGGKHSEAILQFQRAKRLLETESKTLYGSTEIPQDGASGNKLMTEIFSRLSESINRDVKLINANGVHALGLKRGFSKSDVKKAYRVAALKYHPDKNKDCDTSCIFAAIQSGYEKLNATLDAGEVPSHAVPTARRNTYNSAEPGNKEKEEDKHGPNYFYTSHKDAGRRDRGGNNPQKPSPYTFDQTRSQKGGNQRNRDASPRVSPRGTKGDGLYEMFERKQREKAASALSNDHLKLLLKQFGFTDRQVASMSREQLVKRYVGVSEAMKSKDYKKTGGGDKSDRGSFDKNTPPTGRRPTYGDEPAEGGAGEGAVKPPPRDREKEFLARERAGAKDRGKRHSAYRTPSVSYHDPEDDDDSGKFKLPTDFEPSAPGFGKDGGLEGFEAMAKAWADEWSKQMHKDMARDARQYTAQEKMEDLEKEIGLNRPSRGGSNSGKRSRATGPTASSSAARDRTGDGGYEFTHIPDSMKGANGNGNGKEKGDYKSPFASSHYTKKYEKAKKEELLAAEALAQARDKKRRDKEKEREAQGQGDGGKPSSEGEEAASRAQVADALRKERAQWMEQKLPSMSMRELRNICSASGVVWVKGETEDEVAAKLAKHYGVKVPPPRAQQGNADSGTRPPSGGGAGGVSAAEAALKSKFYFSSTQAQTQAQSGSGAASEQGAVDARRKKSPRGDTREDASASANTAPAPAKFISTKQLAELEKKVMGNGGRARRARPSSSEGQAQQQNQQQQQEEAEQENLVSGDRKVEPLRDLGSILSSAARQAAEEEGQEGKSERPAPGESASTAGTKKKQMSEGESTRLLRAVYGADTGKKPKRRAKSKEGARRKSPRGDDKEKDVVNPVVPPIPGPSQGGARGLTIEIEDPTEFLARQEHEQQQQETGQEAQGQGMRRSETAESDIGLDPEEEDLVGWSGRDLVARLEARGWDMDALRPASQRGSPKSPSAEAAQVGGEAGQGKMFRTVTKSQEAIRMRASQGGADPKAEERDKDDEDDERDTSFHSNNSQTSSAGAVTIDSGHNPAGADDREDSGIKFGTGILGSDDEDDDDGEDEESGARAPTESDSDVMEESVPEGSPRFRGSTSSGAASLTAGRGVPDLDSVPKGPKVFEALLKQQEAEEEMKLQQEAEAGDIAVQPGRIRRRGGSNTNSGNPSPESSNPPAGGAASPGASGAKTRSPDLRLNLAAIMKDRETAEGTAERGVGAGEGDVQAEVDFWVNSARSDASGRNTYRELEARMREDEERREEARSSPKKNESPVGTTTGISALDDVSAKLLEKYSSGNANKGSPTGGRSASSGSLSPDEVNKQLQELQRRIQSDKNRDYLDGFLGDEEGEEEENSRAALNKRHKKGSSSPRSKPSSSPGSRTSKGLGDDKDRQEFFFFG